MFVFSLLLVVKASDVTFDDNGTSHIQHVQLSNAIGNTVLVTRSDVN